MTVVSIRDAVEDDVRWVAEREAEIFGPSAWSPSLLKSDWAAGASTYRIAELGGERVGYCVYGEFEDSFSLMNLAVAPGERRKGVAAALLADCLAAARRDGCAQVWLEVAVDNDAAIGLYRAAGFEDVRVRPRYYQPEGTDALVMALDVDAT